jgi:hypothetical protein
MNNIGCAIAGGPGDAGAAAIRGRFERRGPGRAFTPLAAGAVLMVMIYAGGRISGGHYGIPRQAKRGRP